MSSGKLTSSQRFNKKSDQHWIKSPAFHIESEDEKTLSCHANCLNENRYIFQELLAINTGINIVKEIINATILVFLCKTYAFSNHVKILRSSKNKQQYRANA